MHQTLLIYAGGTIGMQKSAQGLVPSTVLESDLRHVLAANELMADFDFLSLQPLIDSANAGPAEWQQLADTIKQHSAYRSYIILHGTDTMAYAAAAVSYLCADLNKSIIFTGAQIPLALPGSDGASNFIGALKARDHHVQGTSLYFGDQLLQANRCAKVSSTDFKAFAAPGGPAPLPTKPGLLISHPLSSAQNTAITVIYFYPGISAATIASQLKAPGLKLALLLSFGAGNIPAADQTIVSALKQAGNDGLALVNISQCRHGGVEQGRYASGSVLSEIG
ncbi:MAG: asparaginase domain-containing protein, partial [Cellvibrionaceae bacterium]|nr:asparaginase domain-containing protein [Cellvibrionaceae bacterium]